MFAPGLGAGRISAKWKLACRPYSAIPDGNTQSPRSTSPLPFEQCDGTPKVRMGWRTKLRPAGPAGLGQRAGALGPSKPL